MKWSELVVIDQPEPTTLTEEAVATLERITDDIDRAARGWASALASHGVEPGDADRFRRAAQVACDRAAHRLRADPPEWLDNWLGPRPPDGPGASVWDDAIARIARHRAVHEVGEGTSGLGPRPPAPEASEPWREAMLGTLRDRVWLTDRQHEPQPIRPTMSPTAMHERRAELLALTSTAPSDHRELIERLTAGDVRLAEVHEHLVAAINAQQERRDWIVANWPHVVELEQVNALINAQPALAHWPIATPPAVKAVLDELASSAPSASPREERTLAALDQNATTTHPVHQAEAKVRDLDELANRAGTDAERVAVDEALRFARLELRQARREQRIDGVFARYGSSPHDDAVERRRLTVGYDALTNPPDWVVDQLHRLHDNGDLGATRVDELATRIAAAAVHLDRHGHLPEHWTAIGPRPATRPVPVVVIDVPGL
jgi:hypothetical protein